MLFTEIVNYDTLERILWIFAIVSLIISSLIFLIKRRKEEKTDERTLMTGFSVFFFFFAILTLFFFLADYLSPISPEYAVFIKIGYCFGITGSFFFICILKKNVKSIKYIFTLLNTVILVIIVIFPFNVVKALVYLVSILVGLTLFIMLFMLSSRHKKLFKGGFPYILAGNLLIFIGQALSSQSLKNFLASITYLAPILYILGSLLAIIPLIRRSKEVFHISLDTLLFLIIGGLSFYIIIGTSLTSPYQFNIFTYLTPEEWFFFNFIPKFLLIIVAIISGSLILFQIRGTVKNIKINRYFFISFALFFYGVAINRTFLIIADYSLLLTGDSLIWLQFNIIGSLFSILSFLFLIYYFEKFYLNSFKLIISKSIMIGAIIILFLILTNFSVNPLGLLLISIIDNYGLIVFCTFNFLLLLRLLVSIKITHVFRFFWLCFGFFLLLSSFLIDGVIAITLQSEASPILLIVQPLLAIIALLIITINLKYGYKIFLEFFNTKQICLIHRGPIEGVTHFCPKCYVKYCENCFNSVIQIENTCWNCNHDLSGVPDSQKIENNEDMKKKGESPLKPSIHKSKDNKSRKIENQ